MDILKLPLGFFVVFLTSCATPIDTRSTYTTILNVDESDNIGGSFLESSDIRTIASQVAAELLVLPEIDQAFSWPVRIVFSPLRNSTAYIFDKDILALKLRSELLKYSKGKLRFISQNKPAQYMRSQIIHERDESNWKSLFKKTAKSLTTSNLILTSEKPLRIGMLEPKSINLVDMNAKSFMVMLRSEVLNIGSEKIHFIHGNKDSVVDYWLTGEFFAESIHEHQFKNKFSTGGVIMNKHGIVTAQTDLTIKKRPNVAKSLAVLLVDSKSEQIVFSDLHNLERKVTKGGGKANYIISGEVKGLHKAAGGDRSDYIITSLQLVDIGSNEILWEYSYETKKVTKRSAVYK